MPFWSWTGTATQAAVGGGQPVIDITAGTGNVVHIIAARSVGAFAGADTLAFQTVDEDNNIVLTLTQIAGSAAPNATLPRAATDMDSTTSLDRGPSLDGVQIAGPDMKFTARATTDLAQNDTVQLLLWAWVKHGPGTISVTRSTGTVAAPTVTVNEVY